MSARTILTLANGRGIDLNNPRAEDVDFDAYAEHLAKENRFNGATPDVVYSVAEHQARGADAIEKATGNTLLAAYFSLHDGKEGVLKDLTTPLKRAIAERAEASFGVLARHILDAINELEEAHDVAIHAAAGLAWPPPPGLAMEVKRWDGIMFVTEWRDLMRGVECPHWGDYEGLKPLPDRISPWGWEHARLALLRRWHKLLPVFDLDEGARA